MSVIKQIKLEDINGSLTELADIGAKAENVEFDNSDSGLEATNLQDAIVEITESGITGLKYTVDGDDNTYATVQNAVEDGTFNGESFTKNVAAGPFSHAEGFETTSNSLAAHAEGYKTLAHLNFAHAEGQQTTARYYGSHAEGDSTLADYNAAHAEGIGTYAFGDAAHAEGQYTEAGPYAHAEGCGSTSYAVGSITPKNFYEDRSTITSVGFGSHAEGTTNRNGGSVPDYNGFIEAVEDGAHAEGFAKGGNSGNAVIIASGLGAHAEGFVEGSNVFTEASGTGSHAEGIGTTASAGGSHSQNLRTIAQGLNQTAIGKYNKAQGSPSTSVSTDYAFIIGNGTGTAATARSNAFAVQWNGAMSQDNGETTFKFTKDADDNKGFEDENGDFNITSLQSTELPTASVDNLGKLYQYIGATTTAYTHNYFYECISDGAATPVYSWEQVDVQPNGGTSSSYATMPTDTQLLAMENKTVFETDGYWTQTDGHGGKYLITTSWTSGALKITNGTTTKYLLALDNDNTLLRRMVDPTRYGVREVAGINGTLTPSGSYATANSEIMSRLVNSNMNATIKFPRGFFVFESPLNLTGRQYNIVGEGSPVTRTAALSLADYDMGTVLCFPFLTNGQTAIQTAGDSNIENLAIYGNKDTYNFTIDRTKLTTAPNEVITETIAENEGTPIQCKAISKTGGGNINNVFICNFYTGITCSGNTFIKNFYARQVHYGINCSNDTKMEGIGGFNVHTLIHITGSICSVLHERVDSCVHALQIINGSSHVITDIDGDWCTDSLIAIGDGTTNGTVAGVIFDGIHGRCNTLKSYDSTQQTDPVDVRELADIDGYGIIRVYANVTFRDSRIVANTCGGGNPMDSASNYLMPDILFTFSSRPADVLDNLTFVLAKGLYNINEILRIVQTRTGFTARFDDASGVYFIEGDTVTTYGESEIELPWVTPQDYGAVGDGVTDDTAAIQAAFNAINTAGGGTVFFPKGIYKVIPTSTIRVYSNTTILGDKGESIIAVDPEFQTSTTMMGIGSASYSATNVHVRGITFRGVENYGSAQSGLRLVEIWRSTNVSFVDCLFQNNMNAAIKLVNSSNIQVFDSRFEAVDCGVISQGNAPVNDVTIRGCHFTGLSSLNNFTNFNSENISIFCGEAGTEPCRRWRIEDCIFEHKATCAVLIGVNGEVTGGGHIACKDIIVRNCTFGGMLSAVTVVEAEDVLLDGLFFDDTPNAMTNHNIHTLLNFRGSKNCIVKNVVSRCTQFVFTLIRFGDAYNSNITIDGFDAIVPYNESNITISVMFASNSDSSIKNSNITIKNVILHDNAKNANRATQIQYANLENSYIDVTPARNDTLVLSHYTPSAYTGTVTNNKIIVNTLADIRRNLEASISVADGNEWVLVGNGHYNASALPTSINKQRIPKVYNVTIPNSTNYDSSLAVTDFYLMNDGYDFYIDFVASSYTVGKTFTFNKTGNIVPIDQPFTFSDDYKVVCHFVQKNAKWVEVERTLEYYAGANVDANDPATDIDFATLLGGE